ncbi:MAG: hypothetical protein AB7L66_15610 [Gemmatimonadales bacterium]
MPPGDVAPVILTSLIALVVGAVLVLRGPVGRAIARRLEGPGAPPSDLEARLQDVEARLTAAEDERHEIQNRLDFAERMLASAREERRELPR